MQKYLSLLFFAVLIGSNAMSQDTLINAPDTMVNIKIAIPATDSISIISQPDIHKEPVYKLKLASDIPVTLIGCGWSGYAFTKIYSKNPLTIEELESLNPDNINSFDRPAIKQYHESAAKIGDYLFYGSMPLPVLFLVDKKMRKDFFKLSFLYLEAMGVTGFIYTGSVYFADRFRPYAYNENAPLDFRLRGGSRNSFFAGHPSLVGTSTFFLATAYADYHPDSKIKWVFYTLASAATVGTSVFRYLGGRHFMSDLIIGTALGPLSGILILKAHKNKKIRKSSTALLPYLGANGGITLIHKF
jgi:membrane-associated phospholipid phosphatase